LGFFCNHDDEGIRFGAKIKQKKQDMEVSARYYPPERQVFYEYQKNSLFELKYVLYHLKN